MFRRIAEWITGHKRRDDKHPLEYVNDKQERIEQAKAESVAVKQDIVWTAGQPAATVPVPAEFPVPPAAQQPQPDKPVAAEAPAIPVSNTEPWPFPKSAPEQVAAEQTAEQPPVKKARKPRQKKV